MHGEFQDHLVVRVVQGRPQEKGYFRRVAHSAQQIQKPANAHSRSAYRVSSTVGA